MDDAATYILSGALPVNEDADNDQIARVSRHLSGIATVYLKRDDVAQTVSLRISGMLTRDDSRYIEQRIERFAEEYTTAAAVLLSEWRGLTRWLVVGMNWQAQCLIKLGAVQEQYAKVADRHLNFVLQLEPDDPLHRRSPLMCISVDTDDDHVIR